MHAFWVVCIFLFVCEVEVACYDYMDLGYFLDKYMWVIF